jgi:hypothetical protein
MSPKKIVAKSLEQGLAKKLLQKVLNRALI